MTRAEILTIGTELLLGEIVDTNTRTIAIALRDNGLDLFRTTTVGDNAERIAQAVAEALKRSEVLITSGGLGPTVDDVTREGISQALGLTLEFREELWAQVVARFNAFGRDPTDNNRRQASIPQGAIGIENPVGTAPAFVVEAGEKAVIALPGVPAELEYLLEQEVLPYLRARAKLPAVIKSRTVRTAGIGESWIDERIQDLERMTNPTVGLAAHPGRVDIRITAKATSEMEADELLWGIEATLQQRLGDEIYGTDQETLETVFLRDVAGAGWKVAVVERGTQGALASALSQAGEGFAGSEELPDDATDEQGAAALSELRAELDAEMGVYLRLASKEDGVDILIVAQEPDGNWSTERSYGGALPNAVAWAISVCLNEVRKHMLGHR